MCENDDVVKRKESTQVYHAPEVAIWNGDVKWRQFKTTQKTKCIGFGNGLRFGYLNSDQLSPVRPPFLFSVLVRPKAILYPCARPSRNVVEQYDEQVSAQRLRFLNTSPTIFSPIEAVPRWYWRLWYMNFCLLEMRGWVIACKRREYQGMMDGWMDDGRAKWTFAWVEFLLYHINAGGGRRRYTPHSLSLSLSLFLDERQNEVLSWDHSDVSWVVGWAQCVELFEAFLLSGDWG